MKVYLLKEDDFERLHNRLELVNLYRGNVLAPSEAVSGFTEAQVQSMKEAIHRAFNYVVRNWEAEIKA